jgi:proline iminopeptidase
LVTRPRSWPTSPPRTAGTSAAAAAPSGAARYTLDHPDRVRALVYVSGTDIDSKATWQEEYARNLRGMLGEHVDRWEELQKRDRVPEEDREFSVLQWSADFADRARALENAERMATPWLASVRR